MTKTYRLQIDVEAPPVVELDSEAHAAYIRFSNRPVVKTRPLMTKDCVVTADYDAADKVVGVELIGVQEFRVDQMLEKAGISPLSQTMLNRASYVPARKEPVAA